MTYKLFAINALIYASLYCVHNFMSSILKDTGLVRMDSIMILQTTEVLKFVFVMMVSYFCGKMHNHKVVLLLSVVLHSVAVFGLTLLVFIENVNVRWVGLVCVKILAECGNGAIFPLMDTLALQNGNIALLKMGGTVGHLGINVLLFGLHFVVGDGNGFFTKNRINALIGIVFAVFAALLLLSLEFDGRTNLLKKNKSANKKFSKKSKDGEIEGDLTSVEVQNIEEGNDSTQQELTQRENSTQRNNSTRIKTTNWFRTVGYLCSQPIFSFYLLSVLLVGSNRAISSQFLTPFMENYKIKRYQSHIVYLIRCIPELVIFFVLSQVIKKDGKKTKLNNIFSLHLLYFTAALLSIARTLCYTTFTEETNAFLCFNLVELVKGVYGAMFGYSAIRLFDFYSTKKHKNGSSDEDENRSENNSNQEKNNQENTVDEEDQYRTTSQGLFYCFYNPFPNIFNSLLGCFIDSKEITNDAMKRVFSTIGLITLLSLFAPIWGGLTCFRRKKLTGMRQY